MSIIKSAYLELVKVLSPVRHARMIGVSLGDNCLVYRSMEWPSEPYLVTIGNNVQLTKGVAIHTHGGGNVVRRKVPDFDVFGKVVIKDWAYIGAHAQIIFDENSLGLRSSTKSAVSPSFKKRGISPTFVTMTGFSVKRYSPSFVGNPH